MGMGRGTAHHRVSQQSGFGLVGALLTASISTLLTLAVLSSVQYSQRAAFSVSQGFDASDLRTTIRAVSSTRETCRSAFLTQQPITVTLPEPGPEWGRADEWRREGVNIGFNLQHIQLASMQLLSPTEADRQGLAENDSHRYWNRLRVQRLEVAENGVLSRHFRQNFLMTELKVRVELLRSREYAIGAPSISFEQSIWIAVWKDGSIVDCSSTPIDTLPPRRDIVCEREVRYEENVYLWNNARQEFLRQRFITVNSYQDTGEYYAPAAIPPGGRFREVPNWDLVFFQASDCEGGTLPPDGYTGELISFYVSNGPVATIEPINPGRAPVAERYFFANIAVNHPNFVRRPGVVMGVAHTNEWPKQPPTLFHVKVRYTER